MDPLEYGFWDSNRGVPALCPRALAVADYEDPSLTFENLPDNIWAEIPQVGNLINRVMPLLETRRRYVA
jgi:hypothetical protein